MKSVLLSIKPKWCQLIASGKKTIEVRKTKPKIKTPFKCYIYETKGKTEIPTFIDEEGHEIYDGRGQVIGEFVCDEIKEVRVVSDYYSFYLQVNGKTDKTINENIIKDSCLTISKLYDYLFPNKGYGWHISDLKIYDEPKELGEFRKPCIYGEESERPCFTCDKSGYAPNMHIDCFNMVTRPPQSWCYVEELEG